MKKTMHYELFLESGFFEATFHKIMNKAYSKNSEYDQEIPQSQTADNPMAPQGRATQPS